MFNTEKDYANAIKNAQIHALSEKKSSNKNLLMVNFLFLAFLGYASFSYLKSNSNEFSLPMFKQAVLGVSETIDDSELVDNRLMNVLKVKEAGILQDSMKVLVSEPFIQSKSSYTEAIARVLDDKSGFKGRIAIVNQSDELSID